MSPWKHHISTVKELKSGYLIDGVTINLENEKYFLWEVEVNHDIQIIKSSSILKEDELMGEVRNHLEEEQHEIISGYYQMLKRILREKSENEE